MNIFYDYQSIFRQRFGGVSRYHHELYQELAKRENVNVTCRVFGSPNYYFQDILKYKPVTNYYGLVGIPYHMNRVSNYLRIVTGKDDIIHPTWYDEYCYVGKNKGKYVVTIHDMIHELFSGFPQNEITGKKFWINHADKIIAVSENTKKDILELYPNVDEKKITVIYHGRNKFPKEQEVKECPSEYFLYVGNRKAKYKNFNILLKAMQVLGQRGEKRILLCAGGGEFTDEEKAMVHDLGLENRIIQMQVTDSELAYLYAHAICFIYPSTYEGFGFPILEAFECGCPVVVSKSSSLPEVAGDAAIYFTPDSIEDLVSQILRVSTSKSFQDELKNKGKRRLQLFSWSKTAEETLDVYRKMLK